LTTRYRLMTPRASILRRLPPVPEGQTAFRSRNGMIVGYYAGRDYISGNLYWFGDFDPWVDATLRRLARPGDIALDIGANIGSTSLVLAHAVGPRGRVIAFEPHPGNARFLRSNLSANALSTVEVQEVALSNSEGSLFLTEPSGQPGMSRLDSGAGERSIPVPTQRLDDWLESRPELGSIAICKIDVEGHEPEVFAGMPNTLAAGRIASFVFERHLPAPAPDDPLLDLLADSGYQVYRIEKSPLKVRYVDPKNPPEARPTSDYVAVHAKGDARARLGLRP
jgi:FkbM family methyltransferase